MIRALVMIIAASAAFTVPASAQLMGATELKVDVPVKGAASTKSVADVFYLVGESGARETYTFVGKGPASLTLFGPDGSEILTSSGKGTVKLEVVLPFTDAFTIAVSRRTPASAYSLIRKTTVPTLTEALTAESVGYAAIGRKVVQCWVIPGVKLRLKYPDGTREETIAADRSTVSWIAQGDRGTFGGETRYDIVDGKARMTTRSTDGANVERNSELLGLAYDATKYGKSTNYLCDDGTK